MPFNKAVMDITGEKHKHLDRALERFEALPHISAQLARMCWLVNWREQIALWRKNGMKRNEVEWLRLQYDEKAYQRYRIASAGKRRKRRGPQPHPNKEDKPVLREVYRDKTKRNINVSDKQAKRLFRPKH